MATTFKQLKKSDSQLRKLEVNASQELTHNSNGIAFLSGFSASISAVSASTWNWTNGLFYRTDISQLAGYKSNFYQDRNLHESCSIVSFPTINSGYKIVPGTFWYEETSGARITTLQDDASGNLYDTTSGSDHIKGNIFYYHSTIVMTNTASQYQDLGNSSQFKFRSTQYIYERSYTCRVGKGEMLGSTNPSAIYGSNSSSTHPSNELVYTPFVPFITTIGLYDNENRLLMTGRLARPIYNDPEQALIFKVKIDM